MPLNKLDMARAVLLICLILYINIGHTGCAEQNVHEIVRGANWKYVYKPKPQAGPKFFVFCHEAERKSITKAWKRIALKFDFSSDSEYELFEESSYERTIQMYEDRRKSWFHFWPLQTTEVPLHLFNHTCIGVSTASTFKAHIDQHDFYPPYVISSMLAVLLFYIAGTLSKNIVFYYGTGVSVGVIASILIMFFILSRLVPGRKTGLLVIFSGFSTFVGLLQYLWKVKMLAIVEENYEIAVIYLVVSGLFSFAVLYWFGPPTNPRSLHIVKWTIQIISFIILYFSLQVKEAAFSLMICLLLVTWFPLGVFSRMRLAWWVRFPPRKRFLTREEYERQGEECTRKALEELRTYCKSPDCDTWKTISKLHTPTRFAEFVEGSFHLRDEELMSFESGDSAFNTPTRPDLDGDNSEDEIDFRLSSQ